ncbi:cell-cell adhesion domain protein [Clostridium ragsdalei P11]|uniref:Cell-cell adhesion domain protein n=1 Tax=Clostridium ragsdalei P11 TaxID=1353534 RepID=A0A1A6AL06_9CLOT|nr:DUF1533 domain-containing protein [Clostridium ragsdalei]OBR90765.1 cell-cell adhesion domain protein [Clostridium ragsdalei P11]
MQIIKTNFNFKKITSWILSVFMILSLITFVGPSSAVSAKTDHSDPATDFAVYIVKNGQTIPLHEYSMAEMRALQTPDPVYYSSIDAMPAAVGTKAQGVLLTTLINDLAKNYNTDAANYSAVKLYCTDTKPNPYRTYLRSFLYGSKRYYFPNLYANFSVDPDTGDPKTTSGALDNPTEVEPMFAVNSFQDRYFNFVTTPGSTGESELKSKTMTGVETFRFCYGQTIKNVTNCDSMTNGYARWTYRVDIILPQAPAMTADTAGKTAGQSVDFSFTDDAAWRGAVTGVTVNGTALDSSKYSISAGKITIDGSEFTAAGDYKIAVQAKGYNDAAVTQTIKAAPVAAPPSMTADSSNNTAGQSIDLTFTDDAAWRNAVTGITVNGKALDSSKYNITAGKITIDGSEFTAAGDYKIAVQATGYSDAEVTQTIQKAPAPALTADSSNNTAGQSIDLAFTDDAAWRNAVTGITVNGTALDSSKYSITAGKITINGSVFTAAGDYKIAVQAKGYSDAEVTQTIQKAPAPIPTTPIYKITPVEDAACKVGSDDKGITTLTVNSGVSGLKYFSTKVAPVKSHQGNETVVFAKYSKGVLIDMNATTADFDMVSSAGAGFNVNEGDVIKIYVVDQLTNDTNVNPVVFQ